jgi:hypothetical protein
MASVIDSDRVRGKAAASQGTRGNSGGTVEDILRRLGVIESSIGEMRNEIGALRTEVGAITSVLPHLATKAELCRVEGSLKAEINSLETRIIKWLIGTVIASTSLAFVIARFVG